MKSLRDVIPAYSPLGEKAGILYPFLVFFISVLLFWKFFIRGLIPLPADTIVGMYHPWRDLYAKEYPNGIPYNNPLITDPVRQQFVWKKLVLDSYKKGELPVENKYSFSGYPLLANFQSGAFYPLNLLFFILPFNLAWGGYIFLQFFLGAIFMFAFLQNILSKNANPEGISTTEGSSHQQIAFIGAIVWILSGFWVAWAEWGNILHTALWLPLILLAIDKISISFVIPAPQRSAGSTPAGTQKIFFWSFVYLFSLVFSFFAGHLQTFFYLYIFSFFYFFYRLRTTPPLAGQAPYKLRTFLLFLIINFSLLIITIPQWYPTFQFILQSARITDVKNTLTRPDWFIPYQHLIQLFIPDYFGNPAKGNYWGIWNYGEFLSYIGIIPFFYAMFSIFQSIKTRKNLFWVITLLVVILFATKNPISQIPYRLQIPFFSTAQPSRLIFLLDFLLIIFFCKSLMLFRRRPESILIFLTFLFFSVIVFFQPEYQQIILRNSIQPIAIFIIFSLISLISPIPLFRKLVLPAIFLLILFDQSRVFWRYNTFASEKYIFPETKITRFLRVELKKSFFRISSLDARIIPPNFSAYYEIPSIDGYDPLYLQTYAEKIRGGKSTGFNRIIQLDSPNIELYKELRVKYVLAFTEIDGDDFKLVMQEGKTLLYEFKK